MEGAKSVTRDGASESVGIYFMNKSTTRSSTIALFVPNPLKKSSCWRLKRVLRFRPMKIFIIVWNRCNRNLALWIVLGARASLTISTKLVIVKACRFMRSLALSN